VTLIVRRYDGKTASIQKSAKELVDAGASLIIGPGDDAGVTALAKAVAGKNVVIVGGAGIADATQGVYSAGLPVAEEAALTVAEMVRRGYRFHAIAATKDPVSKAYAAALANAAKPAGIVTLEVDVTNTNDGIGKLGQLIKPGQQPPHAVAFATGPSKASGIIAGLRADRRFVGIPMVGNSGWAIASQMLPVGANAWFMGPAGNTLAEFAQKFAAANGQQPTLAGAVVYDLVVLAGTLPQVVPVDPYGMDVLTSSDGFQGQTGSFRFDLTGKVQRSYVAVEIK
jgi:hypothetical protein